MPEEDQEVWRIYPKIPFIEASNLGGVRTIDHWVTYRNGRRQLYKGHVLKQYLKNNGYLQVNVQMNGKQVNLLVHRVVVASHLPNPDNLPEVNHKDNNPTNNRLENLEYCTHKYNMAYREKCGVSAKEATKELRCPVIAINPETSEIFYFESQMEAERQLGVRHGNIWSVIKGKRNKAGGLWFCNADKNAVEKIRAKFSDEIANKVEELMNNKQ